MADIFSIVASALDAQNARMSVIASNLANADSVTPPGGTSYRAHEVVFQAAPLDAADNEDDDDGEIAMDGTATGEASAPSDLGVSVAGTVLSNAAPVQSYDPGSPYANADGYVTGSNVSQVGRVDQQMLSSFEVS
jgi:flagellar basal-body rod protein FlgC